MSKSGRKIPAAKTWAIFMKTSQQSQKSSDSSSRKRKHSEMLDTNDNDSEKTTRKAKKKRTRAMLVPCPICAKLIHRKLLNLHLDVDDCQQQTKTETYNEKSNGNDIKNCTQVTSRPTRIIPKQPEVADSHNSTDHINIPTPQQTTASPATPKSEVPKPKHSLSSSSKSAGSSISVPVHPLFTQGALPASAFAAKKKKPAKQLEMTQEMWMHLQVNTDASGDQVTDWNVTWLMADELDKLKCKISEAASSTQTTANVSSSSVHEKCTCSSKLCTVCPLDVALHTEVIIKEKKHCESGSGPDKQKICTLIHISTNLVACRDMSSAVDLNNSLDLASNRFEFTGGARGRRMRFSPSLIKSQVQKCVRMCRVKEAVRSALMLAKKDSLTALLRRLTVIMVEDCVMSVDIMPLVWLMMAESSPAAKEKRYATPLCLVSLVLDIVRKCAACEWKDSYQLDCSPDGITKCLDLVQLATSVRTDGCVRCLLIRAAYGGMKGDVRFLREFAAVWARRGKILEESRMAGISEISLGMELSPKLARELAVPGWTELVDRIMGGMNCSADSVDVRNELKLEPCNLILSAVDFHCSDLVESLKRGQVAWQLCEAWLRSGISAARKFDGVENLIRTMVWEFRSSKTTKESAVDGVDIQAKSDTMQELVALWNTVEPFVDQFSVQFIQSRI